MLHDLSLLDAFPRSYEVDADVELPGGSGGEQVHYVGADAAGIGRDGVLLRLRPEGGAAWLGMFAGCTRVSACPHPFQLLAWGEGAVVGDVRDPASFRDWGPWLLRQAVAAPAEGRLVALGYGDVAALGPDGPAWRQRDDALEDIQTMRVQGDVLHVLAIAPSGSLWESRLDLVTGAFRSRVKLRGPDLPLR